MGLIPSLLLCTNPAINFTVYDIIKNWVLRTVKRNTNNCNSNIKSRSQNRTTLSMVESFGVGLVAKLIATLVTYPLIRAKVMMMTTNRCYQSSKHHEKAKTLTLWTALLKCYYSNNGNNKKCSSGIIITNGNITNKRRGDDSCSSVGKTGGGDWRGLYKGCDYQIVHTACKSALMMMVRERVSDQVRRFLLLRGNRRDVDEALKLAAAKQ
jgi:hypothetical protein